MYGVKNVTALIQFLANAAVPVKVSYVYSCLPEPSDEADPPRKDHH